MVQNEKPTADYQCLIKIKNLHLEIKRFIVEKLIISIDLHF